jgi:prepilin-type N-terminal cleavage/methylation domain-containing protein
MKRKLEQGFTLIELLVVIAIIGLLAGIILINLNNARIKARDAKRAGDVRQMLNAMEQYRIQHNVFPTGTLSSASLNSGNGSLLSDPGAVDGTAEPFTPNYVPMMPVAPSPADESCSDNPGRGNNNYWYDVADDGSTFTITFCLGKNIEGWGAGTRSMTPEGVF